MLLLLLLRRLLSLQWFHLAPLQLALNWSPGGLLFCMLLAVFLGISVVLLLLFCICWWRWWWWVRVIWEVLACLLVAKDLVHRKCTSILLCDACLFWLYLPFAAAAAQKLTFIYGYCYDYWHSVGQVVRFGYKSNKITVKKNANWFVSWVSEREGRKLGENCLPLSASRNWSGWSTLTLSTLLATAIIRRNERAKKKRAVASLCVVGKWINERKKLKDRFQGKVHFFTSYFPFLFFFFWWAVLVAAAIDQLSVAFLWQQMREGGREGSEVAAQQPVSIDHSFFCWPIFFTSFFTCCCWWLTLDLLGACSLNLPLLDFLHCLSLPASQSDAINGLAAGLWALGLMITSSSSSSTSID